MSRGGSYNVPVLSLAHELQCGVSTIAGYVRDYEKATTPAIIWSNNNDGYEFER